MKAIWTGTVGFGLVNIPIKMYSAVEENTPDLDMLDKKDLSNIKYKRVNESTGKEVAWENIVRGYYLNNRYVVLNDKDFESIIPEKTRHIEIKEFVDEKEIDSIYFELPYYLEPEKNGSRPYALLREALKKTGKAGVGLFVMHKREHVAIIKASDKVLVLHRIRFEEEIRSPEDLHLPANTRKPDELKLAISLVDQLADSFNPKKYKDEYSGKLMKIIRAKAKGQKLPYKPMKIVHSTKDDLVTQLKKSLTKSKAS